MSNPCQVRYRCSATTAAASSSSRGYALPLTTRPDVRETRYLAPRNQELSLSLFRSPRALAQLVLARANSHPGSGIDDCAANIVSQIVPTIVKLATYCPRTAF